MWEAINLPQFTLFLCVCVCGVVNSIWAGRWCVTFHISPYHPAPLLLWLGYRKQSRTLTPAHGRCRGTAVDAHMRIHTHTLSLLPTRTWPAKAVAWITICGETVCFGGAAVQNYNEQWNDFAQTTPNNSTLNVAIRATAMCNSSSNSILNVQYPPVFWHRYCTWEKQENPFQNVLMLLLNEYKWSA